MEFGDQSESMAVNTKKPNSPATARRRVTALVATLLVIVVGVAGFWFFTPKSHQGSNIAHTPTVSATATPHQRVQTPLQTPVMGKSFVTQNSLPVIKNPTSLFLPNDSIIVIAKVVGAKAGDIVSAKWYQNGKDLTPAFKSTKTNCCSETMNGQTVEVTFQASFPGIGPGKVELYYNTTLAYSLDFDVVVT
ncbi:MAG TPA: hypothetical protein VKB76_10080 [Ktedonobacterales bacterium]|nr:hypothetical protein [Ktedonobacterales bacterium]